MAKYRSVQPSDSIFIELETILLSPPVQVAWWAPMRHFPSVCDKNSYYMINHSWKGIVGSQMKIGHNVLDVWGISEKYELHSKEKIAVKLAFVGLSVTKNQMSVTKY